MFAWLVGEGIIIYRWVKNGAPPTPGAILLPSGVYLALAIMAEYQPARFAATALAWGFDAAVLLQIVGKEPKQATGWPPPKINDPSRILPGGAAVTGTAAINTTSVISGTGTAAPATGTAPPATLA
jgi:hypothetical protein